MSRLFHTLVVYGASAALTGCGAGQDDGSPTPSGGTGGGGTGGAAEGGSGGTGSAVGGSSGSTAIGGSGGSSAGGLLDEGGGAGGFVAELGPSAYSQWQCIADDATNCNGLVLTAPCEVDPTRPRTPRDCADGEWFECYRASFDGVEILVDCSCVPKTNLDGCSDCSTANALFDTHAESTCSGTVSICDCRTGILLK